jgi:uncharacterized protein YwgA
MGMVELKAFVEFLKERFGFVFDVNRFDHRIRLQKYVFIANFLGWDHNYPYNIYIRGPYSHELAKDYYNLQSVSVRDETGLAEFDKESFAFIIDGKNIQWLEVATTMLSLYSNNKDRIKGRKISSFLIERTKDIKSEYDKDEFIENVFNDLNEYSLVNLS